MAVLREIRRRSRQIAPQVLLACTLAYFTYHAMEGDRGVLAWIRLEQELTQTKAARAELLVERLGLERRVSLLRPDHLDPDMLEERARAVLNYGHADDLMIFMSNGGREPGHRSGNSAPALPRNSVTKNQVKTRQSL